MQSESNLQFYVKYVMELKLVAPDSSCTASLIDVVILVQYVIPFTFLSLAWFTQGLESSCVIPAHAMLSVFSTAWELGNVRY